MDEQITSKIWEALSYIIVGAVVYFAYKAGMNGFLNKKETPSYLQIDIDNELDINTLLKRLFKGFGIILVISFFIASSVSYGTETCSDSDPLRGGGTDCEYTEGNGQFVPEFVYALTLLGIPYLIGGSFKYSNIKNGRAKTRYDNAILIKEKREKEMYKETEKEYKEMMKEIKKDRVNK